MNDRHEQLKQRVMDAAREFLDYGRAATIILPLPEREGYYVAIGTAEGIRGTLDAAMEELK